MVSLREWFTVLLTTGKFAVQGHSSSKVRPSMDTMQTQIVLGLHSTCHCVSTIYLMS